MKRRGGEEELDGKYFGHTDSDKKLELHIAGFQANPGEKKKEVSGTAAQDSGCWIFQLAI